MTRPDRALLCACHPGPTVAVTVIAVLLAWSAEADAPTLLLVFTTVLVGQLSIGWSNDWWDAARDRTAGRHDKPAARGEIAAATLGRAAGLAAAASVPLSLLAGWVGLWHLVLVGAGWLYNLALKPTLWSPLPYLVGFAALPIYVLAVSGAGVPAWVVAAGGQLGASAHFANAAPDVAEDRLLGVNGLPQRLGSGASVVVSLVLLGATGTLLLVQLAPSGLAAAVGVAAVLVPIATGAALVATGRIGPPVFRLVMASAVIDVGLFVIAA